MIHVNVSVNGIAHTKKIVVGILAQAFVRQQYLSFVDTSVIGCNEIIDAPDRVRTNVTNTIPTKRQEYCFNKF